MAVTSAAELGHSGQLAMTLLKGWSDLPPYSGILLIHPSHLFPVCVFRLQVAHNSRNLYEKLSLFHLTYCIVSIKDKQKQRDNSYTQKLEYGEMKTGELEKMCLLGDLFCS